MRHSVANAAEARDARSRLRAMPSSPLIKTELEVTAPFSIASEVASVSHKTVEVLEHDVSSVRKQLAFLSGNS